MHSSLLRTKVIFVKQSLQNLVREINQKNCKNCKNLRKMSKLFQIRSPFISYCKEEPAQETRTSC